MHFLSLEFYSILSPSLFFLSTSILIYTIMGYFVHLKIYRKNKCDADTCIQFRTRIVSSCFLLVAVVAMTPDTSSASSKSKIMVSAKQ